MAPISGTPFNLLFASVTAILLLPELNQAAVRIIVGTCHASGYIKSNGGACPASNDVGCCQAGQTYPQYNCSPEVTSATFAIMNQITFDNTTTDCRNKTHTDDDLVVTLSTGWYNKGFRCMRNITINGNNGNIVVAQVVGECDSWYGCDTSNGNSPPCVQNVVMASPAVWKQLGIPSSQTNELDITWSDTS